MITIEISKVDFQIKHSPIAVFFRADNSLETIVVNVNDIEPGSVDFIQDKVVFTFSQGNLFFTLIIDPVYSGIIKDIYEYKINRVKASSNWKAEFKSTVGWLPCLN